MIENMDSSSLYQFIREVPITAWIATVAIILYTKYLHQGGKKYKRLPPGPKGYPILGTFPAFIGNEAHIVFDRKLSSTPSKKNQGLFRPKIQNNVRDEQNLNP